MSRPDPTMRVVWYNGRAYPVTAHPQGLSDPGTHWHVQTENGDWHAVMPRLDGDSEGELWRGVVRAIVAWLEAESARKNS